MIKKVYYIRQDKCDPFKGSQTSYIRVEGTAKEAMDTFWHEASFDFCYDGNDYVSTYLPRALWQYVPEPQRYHARAAWQWDDICYKKAREQARQAISNDIIEWLAEEEMFII